MSVDGATNKQGQRIHSRKMTKYTNEELKEGSKHLLYEITMMEQDLRVIRSILAAEKTPLKHYISPFLNSFFIHARCIYEFLFEDKNRFPDDIKPSDYAEIEKWKKPNLPEELKKWKTEIDKRVVHLTFHRLEIEEIKKRWEVGYIYLELQKALLAFYRWVPISNICDAFIEEREHALEEAESKHRGTISKEIITGTSTD